MRIVFAALGFGDGDNLGGGSRMAGLQALHLARLGHQVSFFCTNRIDKFRAMPAGTKIVQDGLVVHYLPTRTIARWPGDFGPQWVAGAAALRCAVAGADVVHIHEVRHMPALLAARAARRRHVPVVLQPHGTLAIHANSRTLKRCFDWWAGGALIAGARFVLTLAEVEAEAAAQAGVRPDRIRQLPNGIDRAQYAPMPVRGGFRRRFGIPVDAPLLLSAGRLVPYKGQDIAIRALSEVADARVWLALVGPDVQCRRELERLATERGVADRVVFAGEIPNAEILTAFQDADVMLLPSRIDMFPVVILEAALAGKAMVVSSACRAAGRFRDRCALVVDPEPRAFAAAVESLLADRKLRSRFEVEATRLAEQDFSLASVVGQLVAIYREAAARP